MTTGQKKSIGRLGNQARNQSISTRRKKREFVGIKIAISKQLPRSGKPYLSWLC